MISRPTWPRLTTRAWWRFRRSYGARVRAFSRAVVGWSRRAGLGLLAGVTSHPDLNGAGVASFYGDVLGGGQGVFVLRDGRLQTIADTSHFASIGPLGPTLNEAGVVGFRADRVVGVSGVFAGDGATVVTIADTNGRWGRFHGLPVINSVGTLVFRADRDDGVQGIYAGREGSIWTVAETGDLFETLAWFPSLNDHGMVAFAASRGLAVRGSSLRRRAESPASLIRTARSRRFVAP